MNNECWIMKEKKWIRNIFFRFHFVIRNSAFDIHHFIIDRTYFTELLPVICYSFIFRLRSAWRVHLHTERSRSVIIVIQEWYFISEQILNCILSQFFWCELFVYCDCKSHISMKLISYLLLLSYLPTKDTINVNL